MTRRKDRWMLLVMFGGVTAALAILGMGIAWGINPTEDTSRFELIEDEQNEVGCWILRETGSISCIPFSEYRR